MIPRFLACALAMAPALALPGCVAPNRVTLESTDRGSELVARFPVVVYASQDAGAEILLTDLSLDELDPATDPGALSGSIVRISMVVRPKPGATPIDPTAANATVQYLILSRGAIGLYSGGAFVNPSEPWGSDTLGARIRGATLRLTAGNPRFEDRLGPTRMRAHFTAVPDEALVARAADKLEQIVAGLYREDDGQ